MKDYQDILNRRTYKDNFSDALNKQADSIGRPMNKGQADTSAILRGFAAGFSHDSEREAKLAELENMSKELTMNKYALEMQSGENELKKQKDLAFFNKTRHDMSIMSDFANKGDNEAVKLMLPTFLKKYEDIYGESAGRLVDFHDGRVYLEKDGKVKTQHLADLADHVIPENEKGNFTGLLTYNSKQAVQNKLEEQRLKNEHIRANIDASRASVESSKAHAELYKSQANPDLIAAEMDYKKAQAEKLRQTDISKEQQHVSKEITNSNFKYIDENFKKISTNKRVIEAYKKINNLMSEESNSLWNREGSGFISTLQRWSDPSITDANVRQARIELEKMPLWSEFKEIFGAKASDQDLKAFLTTMPDLNKPYKANKEAILGRIEDLEQSTFNIENTIDILEKSNYLTHHSNSSVRRELEERNNKRKEDILLDNGNNVKMKDKNNKIYYIPKNDVDKAINDGLEKYE